MDYQAAFNILMGAGAFLASWWMKAVWTSIQALRESDSAQVTKLNSIEILVTGQYARRDEVDRLATTLTNKLDRIEQLEVTIANHYVLKTDFSGMIDKLYTKIDKLSEKLDNRG